MKHKMQRTVNQLLIWMPVWILGGGISGYSKRILERKIGIIDSHIGNYSLGDYLSIACRETQFLFFFLNHYFSLGGHEI